MGGISLMTALEMFTNPYDLQILIGQEKDGDKYSIAITRGPGHRFKLMIDSKPFAEKIEEALGSIQNILESVHRYVTKELEDPTTMAAQFLNPEGRPVDQTQSLNAELIQRIMEELKLHKVASTYKMIPAIAG